MAEAATTYDELPYGSNVFAYTHPDRLATFAELLGMEPAPLDRCRVLELGCGTGTNVIAMAQAFPRSSFVGIDLSSRQIDMGHAMQRALGLENLDLRALSILDVNDALGQFDYIICHGVYSWVPEQVQDKILSICSRNLRPAGVTYISYNTYPGWHLRGMVREMMRFHVGQFAEPMARVAQARALLEFLLEASGNDDSVYCHVLRREAAMLEGSSDTYLYHEHLEEVNYPLYFHQFAHRAAAKGLQYMAEAWPIPLPANLSAKAQQTLEQVSVDLVHAEQYLDFVRNSTFRRSLLCHANVKLQRPPRARAVLNMKITGLVKPVSDQVDLTPGVPADFRNEMGVVLATNQPLVKAALLCLAKTWPHSLPFADLWAQVLARLEQAKIPTAGSAPLVLCNALIQCFLADLTELHVFSLPFTTFVGERPLASPLARLLAEKSHQVANLRHRSVNLSEFECQVLCRLDGTRDRDSLLQDLVEAVAKGDLTIEQHDKPLSDLDQIRKVLAPSLEPTLARFAQIALLVE